MKTPFFLILFLTSLVSLNCFSQSTWTFDDAHSNLQFSVTNLMVAEVEGSMQLSKATLTGSKADMSDASIFILADVKTIDTDNDGRDEHLRSADFFHAEKYPDLTFQGSGFKKTGDNQYSVNGQLTFHGITKDVTMNIIATEAIRPYDNKTIIGFKSTGIIKRSDFDIAATTPSAILSDEVEIKGNVIFVKE